MTGELISLTFDCGTEYCSSSGEGLDWTFSTVMFWGEAQIDGTWSLIVRDSSKNSYSTSSHDVGMFCNAHRIPLICWYTVVMETSFMGHINL